jgi:hypothetical protein
MKKCAFDKEKPCNDSCVAYKQWYTRDCIGVNWENIKCLRGDFMIKKQGESHEP